MKPKYKHQVRICIGKDIDGKYKYKRFTGYGDTERAAQRAAESLANEYTVLHRDDFKPRCMTLCEALTRYINAKENVLSPSTIRGYNTIAKNHLQSIAQTPVDELTQLTLQVAINEEAARSSPKTVRNISGLLSATLEMVRPDFKFHITLPQKVRHEVQVPDNDAVLVILQNVRENDFEMFKAIVLAAFGSLRRSEISALTLEDIKDGRVLISKAMVPDKENKFVVKNTPKTDKSYRAVKMPDSVLPLLIQSADGEHIVALNPAMITARFRTIARHCGIDGFTFHGLRHYQASVLHAIGVPDQYIMERGGWSTDATLKRVYQHTMSEARKKEEAKICDFFDEKFKID